MMMRLQCKDGTLPVTLVLALLVVEITQKNFFDIMMFVMVNLNLELIYFFKPVVTLDPGLYQIKPM